MYLYVISIYISCMNSFQACFSFVLMCLFLQSFYLYTRDMFSLLKFHFAFINSVMLSVFEYLIGLEK